MATMRLAVAADNPPPTGRAPPTRVPNMDIQAPGPAGEQIATAAMPSEIRRAVVADAAKRFGVAESSVVLTGAEKVTWPDGALGCPEPGMMYTQAQVPGYRVAAKTSGGELYYHTDARRSVVSCGRAQSAKTINPNS